MAPEPLRKPGTGFRTAALVRICGLLAALAVMTPSGSGHAKPAAQDPDIDLQAMEALARTSAYLRTLSAFVVRAETTRDEIVRGDIKPQRTADVRVAVRGRDRMRAETTDDQGERLLVYNGTVLQVHLKTERYYASMAAPSTLGETLEAALERHGIELPLLDMIYLATGGELSSRVRAARYVGTSTIGGVHCEHLAFRGTHVDWQLWIAAGDKPLPHKLVIATKDAPSWQQYSALLRWEISPELHDGEFAFSPPRGTSPIALGPAPAGADALGEGRRSAIAPSGTARAARSGNGSQLTNVTGAGVEGRRWRGGWFTLLLAALPFVHVPALEELPRARARSRHIPVSSVHAAERDTSVDDHADASDARGAPVAAPAPAARTPKAAPPARCHVLVARAQTYQHCGGIYYQPVYDGSSVQYVIVSPP